MNSEAINTKKNSEIIRRLFNTVKRKIFVLRNDNPVTVVIRCGRKNNQFTHAIHFEHFESPYTTLILIIN